MHCALQVKTSCGLWVEEEQGQIAFTLLHIFHFLLTGKQNDTFFKLLGVTTPANLEMGTIILNILGKGACKSIFVIYN